MGFGPGQYSRICSILSLSCLFGAALAGASVSEQRIHSNISDRETFVLKGNTRPVIERGLARDEGEVHASLVLPRMVMHFAMTPAQRSDLDQLLKAQQDRRSPQYHQFLTPEQYAARFGLDSRDIDRVVRWLENAGFVNPQVARSKTWISFSGTAAEAEAAFHVSMHRYSLNGETHYANAGDPQLPKALEGIVEGVRGFHNFAMKPFARRPRPNFTSSSDGSHYLAPDDWTTIYDVKPLYGAGIDGTGVKIAVVGQSDVSLTDIRAFRAAAGLTVKDPTVIVPPGSLDPGIQSGSGNEIESDLDLEWAGAIARNADILFITASAKSGNGVGDSITYAIDQNVAPIVSISYGFCEPDLSAAEFKSLNSQYQQANAQGMTIVAASGDSGAAGCDADPNQIYATHGLAVNFPASSAYVTGVGGTEFNEKAGYGGNYWSSTNNSANGSVLSYIPEIAWDKMAPGFNGGATGGGASKLVPKPGWQTGPGVPADAARDVPDLAYAASPEHDGLLICAQGSCTNGFLDSNGDAFVIGGTSAGAPAFAGVLALTVEEHGAGTRLGNINANLYSLGQISATAFHDVTLGANFVPCTSGTPDCSPDLDLGFPAGPGYDQTTGWGSLDGSNFAEQWYGDIQLSASPAALTIEPGASATATITLSPQNNFTGPVSFTCSVPSALYDVTCSIPNTTLNTSGTTTITISVGGPARTPFWKRLHLPPYGRRSLLLLSLGLLFALLVAVSRYTPVCKMPTYAAASVVLFGIAMGAVSCGGSGSDASSGAGTSGSGPAPVPLKLTCNLGSATIGTAYTGNCVASGGTGALTFSMSAGNLPSGLSLNSANGAITGVPNREGTSSFSIQVTDSGSPVQTATAAVANFTVLGAAPLSLTCNMTGNGTTGLFYTGTCSWNGGFGGYTSSIAAGALPPGLILSPQSNIIDIQGYPTTPGTSSFVVQITDSENPPQTASAAIDNFLVVAGPLSFGCDPGPIGSVAKPFSFLCQTYGGTPPFTYAIVAGAIPPGLTLDSSAGRIFGAPTTEGSYSFTMQAVDSSSPPLSAQLNGNISIAPRQPESGLVTITGTSGGIVNTTTIAVSVP